MKKLLVNGLIIIAVSTIAFRLTSSFFSDTETSSGNVLAAGTLDLKIGNTSYYNGLPSSNTSWETDDLPGHLFFDFNDLKPSDWGEDTIALEVQNDAWACMKVNLTANDDQTCTEPEMLDDISCSEPNSNLLDGELAAQVNFFFWSDDGDNVFEVGENIFKSGSSETLFDGATWVLADSTSSIWNLSPTPVPGGATRHIGKYWCFGNITPSPLPQGSYQVSPSVSGFVCDGSLLNNATQTDRVLLDIEFTAVQARNNPNYRCLPFTPSPTPTPVLPTPTTLACVETFASSFEQVNQGTNKNGSPVLVSRSNGNFALGSPQSTGTPYDTPVSNSFFSLGFNLNQTEGGSIVLKFTSPFYNQPGNDLQVYEVTGGTSYPDERIKLEVSSDSSTWTTVASNVARDALIDISPIPSAQYVRITDVSNIALFEPAADGYDLDAVKALCGTNN